MLSAVKCLRYITNIILIIINHQTTCNNQTGLWNSTGWRRCHLRIKRSMASKWWSSVEIHGSGVGESEGEGERKDEGV